MCPEVLCLTLWRAPQSPGPPLGACSRGEQVSTYLELRLVLCLSNFSDLVYFIISDPVSLSLISKARAGLHGSLNGPLVLIKILV